MAISNEEKMETENQEEKTCLESDTLRKAFQKTCQKLDLMPQDILEALVSKWLEEQEESN